MKTLDFKKIKFIYNYDDYNIHGTLKEEYDNVIDDYNVDINKIQKLVALIKIERYYYDKKMDLQYITYFPGMSEDMGLVLQRCLDRDQNASIYYSMAQTKLDLRNKTDSVIFQKDKNTKVQLKRVNDDLYGTIFQNHFSYQFQMSFDDYLLFMPQKRFDEYIDTIIKEQKQEIEK